MAKKTTEYCGVTFEVYTSNIHPVAPITGYDYDEIYKVYDRPSRAKVGIWHDWCEWVDEMLHAGYKCGIEISGHSCFSFSITGSIRNDDTDEVYDIFITRDHNRLYKHRAI